jgi:Arc/MetJ family transcription regulator
MRTNVVLDDDLVEEASRVTGIRVKKHLIHEALRVLLAARKRRSLLDLRSKIRFAPGFDHRSLRKGRT